MATPTKPTAVQTLTVDTQSLTPVAAPAMASPSELDELRRVLGRFVEQGILEQRPDGSLMLPGFVDPRQERLDRLGSDCDCPQCTPFNQHHWYCAGCYSGPHEWVIRQPKGDAITILGAAGLSGKSWQFCTPDCGRVFRQRHASLQPPSSAAPTNGVPNIDGIPIAGGDDFPTR